MVSFALALAHAHATTLPPKAFLKSLVVVGSHGCEGPFASLIGGGSGLVESSPTSSAIVVHTTPSCDAPNGVSVAVDAGVPPPKPFSSTGR